MHKTPNKLGEFRLIFLAILGVLFLYFSLMQDPTKAPLVVLTGVASVVLLPYFIQNISFALQLIIFLVPLSIDVALVGETKVSLPSELLLILLSITILVKWLGGMKIDFSLLKHPLTHLLLLDLGWTICTSIFSEIPAVSFKRTLIKILFIAVFYGGILLFFKNQKTFQRLYYVYGIGLIIPILYTTYRHASLGLKQKNSILISHPFFAEHTIYAAVVAFVLPFFIFKLFQSKKSFPFVFGVFSLLVVAVTLSYSRAAWISLVVALLFYILTLFKIKFYPLLTGIGIVLLIGVFNFNSVYDEMKRTNAKYGDEISQHLTSVTNLQNDASNLERINRWVSAVEMFKAKPLTGFGPGTYQFVYDRFQETRNMTRISTHFGDKGNAHSEYLMYLAEMGIIGFLLFISTLFYSLFLALKLLQKPLNSESRQLVFAAILGLITFYIHGLFNSFIDSEKIAVLYFGSLAILVWVDKKGSLNRYENEMDSDT
tara:strand:+ start:12559 stop:14013 length:1455 start_codon:yes stop_codon:yes gene_type:complete